MYRYCGLLSSINSAASASFWWIILATPSCLFTYSVGASCSHAAVMCWIVSDSFPHLLHSSSVSGCFKIYFFYFLISMTWSCIAVKKPSVFGEQIRICQPFVRRFYVYILLAEVMRMAAMQGFLGPLSVDFVIIFSICGELICICADQVQRCATIVWFCYCSVKRRCDLFV